MRLLCLTNAIRRFEVKSLPTGSPPDITLPLTHGIDWTYFGETFPGFQREKCLEKIVFPGRHFPPPRTRKGQLYIYTPHAYNDRNDAG